MRYNSILHKTIDKKGDRTMIVESIFGLIILVLLGLMFSIAIKSYTQDEKEERDYK